MHIHTYIVRNFTHIALPLGASYSHRLEEDTLREIPQTPHNRMRAACTSTTHRACRWSLESYETSMARRTDDRMIDHTSAGKRGSEKKRQRVTKWIEPHS